VNERDRMLAEGPREAPEAATAETMATGDAPPAPAPAPAPSPARRARTRGGRSPWLRLVPIALVAILTGVRALGDGFGGYIVVAVILAVGLIEYLRRRAR
jgi:Flp pilus assembly protein TadB